MSILRNGSLTLRLAALALALAAPGSALAQSTGAPHVQITPHNPNIINLPVIPQGSYLDPGGAVKPDVGIGNDRNEDYVFPPNLDGFMGASPPGDPTTGGGWSPLPGDTPSF